MPEGAGYDTVDTRTLASLSASTLEKCNHVTNRKRPSRSRRARGKKKYGTSQKVHDQFSKR